MEGTIEKIGGPSYRLKAALFLIITTFFGILVSSPICHAQQTFVDPQLQPYILEGVGLVTNTDYAEAFNKFERMRELAPDDPSSYFLKGTIYWYRLVIEDEENEVLENLFFKYMDETIEKAKQLQRQNKDDVIALFWLGAGYGYKARYHSVKGQWWSAYRNGKRTKRYFERVVAMAPEDYDPYLGLGIYHYYAEVVPKIIRIFDFILNMGGDRELGLKELEMALDNGFFTQNEAKFFLVDIFLNYENRLWEALAFLLDLAHTFPANRGFKWRLAELYGQLQIQDAAAKTWQELERDYSDNLAKRRTARINWGEQALKSGKFAQAKSILLKAVRNDEQDEPSLLGRADYAMALACDLLGDRDEALVHYRKVIEVGKGEMAQASKRRVENPEKLPIEILEKCSQIFATTDLPAERVQSLESELRKSLPSSGKKEKELYCSALVNIGKYYLFHGDPLKAKDIFTEIVSSDLPKSGRLEACLYELRGIANYRLDLFAESLDDFKRAYEKAEDGEKDRIEKDMAFMRGSSERGFSARGDRDSIASEQERLPCKFTCSDRGQLAVSVVGSFNGWNPEKGQMILVSGEWTKEFELRPGEHRYYFLINGWQRRIDPQAEAVERESGTLYCSVRNVGS